MRNDIYKTSLGRINRNYLKQQENKRNEEFIHAYNLETVKAWHDFKPKNFYEFWKKGESSEQYIRRKTIEKLKHDRLRLKTKN